MVLSFFLFFFFLAFCKTINDQGILIGLKILSRLIEVSKTV